MHNIRVLLILLALLPGPEHCCAQVGRLEKLFAGRDTTAVMDSLLVGFDTYLDSLLAPKSNLTATAGFGNQHFSLKNNAFNAAASDTRQLSVLPALTYYHKSGLGISATGFLTQLCNRLQFYQYAITPSYDYSGKHFAAGVSWSRYFGKDTVSLDASPYNNDYYGYALLQRGHWRLGMTVGYASGSFNDRLTYSDSLRRYNSQQQQYEWVHYTKTIRTSNTLRDISVSVIVRREFSWYGVFAAKDGLTLSVGASLVTGASQLNTATVVKYSTKKIVLSRFTRSYRGADGNGYQLQSAALSGSLFYSCGRVSVMPSLFADYYLQDSERKLSSLFSLSIAYVVF